MKLNFWQWLGIGLLTIGLIFVIYDRTSTTDTVDPTAPATTAPATAPATEGAPL